MDKNELKTLKNQRKNGIISSVKMSALKEMKKPTKYHGQQSKKTLNKERNPKKEFLSFK